MTKRAKRMPESNTQKAAVDIATLAANQINLKEDIASLTGEVRAGNQQNGQILAQIAVLASKQEDNNKYQELCDKDRDEIRKEISDTAAKLHGRITENSTAISRISGKSAGIAITVSTIISVAALWIEFVHK